MANDWLKIKVDGTSEWGTTGTGPSGTTGITISADTCDAAIARCATIVFRAGSLTKRLKVTQGISASPKIQLVPSFLTIGKNQTGTTNLTVSNVSDITGWYWVLTSPSTQSLINGVDIYNGNTSISLPYTGVGVSSTAIKVKNKTNDTGNLVFQGTLYSSDGTQLSSQNVNFQLTGDQNPEPTITLAYAGGSTIPLHIGTPETITVTVNTPNATRYEWHVGYGDVLTGIDITPVSGITNNASVTLTNSTRDSGSSSVWGQVTAYYSDGTSKNSSIFSINVLFMGIVYDYELIVDNLSQIPSSLSYYNNTTVRFHVQDKNGNPITTNDLSWEWRSDDYQWDTILRSSPRQGTFTSSGSYAGTSELKNINRNWLETSVGLTLCLLKQGEASPIDFVEIPRITLYSEPKLWLVEPEPATPGGSVDVNLPSDGDENYTITFISNANWEASLNSATTQNGFRIKVNGSEVTTTNGAPGSTSSDTLSIVVKCPQNPSLTDDLFGSVGLSINGSSCYVHIYVTTTAPYIRISDGYTPPEGGHLYKLPNIITPSAFAIPLTTNVTSFKIFYNDSETGCPDWLSAQVQQIQGTYSLILGAAAANTETHDRPRSTDNPPYIAIDLGYGDDYVWNQGDNIVHVRQNAALPATSHFIIYKAGEIFYDSDYPDSTSRDIDWQGLEINDGWIFTISGTSNNASYTTAKWRLDSQTFLSNDGLWKRDSVESSNWTPLDDDKLSSEALLTIGTNTSYVNTRTLSLTVSQDNSNLVTFTFTQHEKPQSFDDGFDIVWTTSGRLRFKGNVHVGDTQYSAGTCVYITVHKTNGDIITQEAYIVGNGTETLNRNSSYYFHASGEYPEFTSEDFMPDEGIQIESSTLASALFDIRFGNAHIENVAYSTGGAVVS